MEGPATESLGTVAEVVSKRIVMIKKRMIMKKIFVVIRKEDRGERVSALQAILNRVMDFHLMVDGDFGGKTEDAVKVFQGQHVDAEGVFLTPDGVVGEKTVCALGKIVGPDAVSVLMKYENDMPAFAQRLVLKKAKKKVRGIVLHCTAEYENKCQDTDAKRIDQMHKARGWKEIGYNYVIKRDGTIENGRDVEKRGAHADAKNTLVKDRYDLNTYALSVVYVGGLDKNGNAKDTRTPEQVESMKWLVRELCKMYGLSPDEVYGHYQFAKKACPCFKIETFRPLLMMLMMVVMCVMGGCSKKVVESIEDNESETVVNMSQEKSVTDSVGWKYRGDSVTRIEWDWNEWWKAHVVRTHYGVDSLGNEIVTLREEIELEGGRDGAESVESREGVECEGVRVIEEQEADSISAYRMEVGHKESKAMRQSWWDKPLIRLLMSVSAILFTAFVAIALAFRFRCKANA